MIDPQQTNDAMPPGRAYLLEHGRAADGSSGDNTESTQHLVNPPAHNPTENDTVRQWVRRRALGDAQMQQAAAAARTAAAAAARPAESEAHA